MAESLLSKAAGLAERKHGLQPEELFVDELIVNQVPP